MPLVQAWDKIGGGPVLANRQPAYRWHDLRTGVYKELENLSSRCKGSRPSGDPTRPRVPMRGTGADSFVVAMQGL